MFLEWFQRYQSTTEDVGDGSGRRRSTLNFTSKYTDIYLFL